MTNKFCIFCGRPPERKSKEHVVPQWLLSLTGKPNRSVYLGRDWMAPGIPKREFAFAGFTFPACTDCNTRFASIEGTAKSTVERMLAQDAITASDIDDLLDWMDKVRIGLWLAMVYLNKNYRNVEPQFHIESRIAARDRLLFIYSDNDKMDGIGMTGIDSPIFHTMPSCLYLAVNHLHFFNVSTNWLISKQLGFPYPIVRQLVRDKEGEIVELCAGTQEVKLPLVPFETKTGGSYFYQPIIPRDLRIGDPDTLKEYYDNQFVRDNCVNYVDGKGKVFHQRNDAIVEYPIAASTEWIPPKTFTKFELMADLGTLNGVWQDAIYSDVASTENLPEEQLEFIESQMNGIRKIHKLMTDHNSRQIKNSDHVKYVRDSLSS